MTEPDAEHDSAVDRRYICTDCETIVRARWSQSGDGFPGGFHVGCDCTTVPVVPQMTQSETPDNWRVQRPECCRFVDVNELETHHQGVCDYRCSDCGATYRWDGTMSTSPDLSDDSLDEGQQLLTDGGQPTESADRDHRSAKTESGEISIHDEEGGIHIEARVEGVPQGAVARRLIPILRLVDYHRFQSRDGDDDE